MTTLSAPLGLAERNRLQWRGRRGLLECDLLVHRFLAAHGQAMTQPQADGFAALMALDDPELLDLLLRRTEPDNALAHDDNARAVLALMRVN